MSFLLGILLLSFPIEYEDILPQIPAFVNPYDPGLGGINCNDDCLRLANGYEWQESDYGRLAACPPDLMACYVTFRNDHDTAGPYLCYDTGGALLEPVRYDNKFDGQLVQHFDVLWDLTDEDGERISNDMLPWWNHALFTDWEAEC
jgi:hypothetical protein